MNTELDQIRIAEVLGYEPVVPLIPGNLRFVKIAGDPNFAFDPFTDANHDYAVLEWIRKQVIDEHGALPSGKPRWSSSDEWWAFWDALQPQSRAEYKIGDYARAALKVLNESTESSHEG